MEGFFLHFNMNLNTIIVSITGASGSGKTTFAKELISVFPKNKITLISQDSYYKDLSHLTIQERSSQNFDHPNALDLDLLKKHLITLKNGDKITQPIYDFNTHSRINSTKIIYPREIIIVEGTLAVSKKILYQLYDIIIYIDQDQNTCLERRIKRDITERGRSRKCVIEQYNSTVKPMFEKFIYPCRKLAHEIVPGNNNNEYISPISEKIKNRLKIM